MDPKACLLRYLDALADGDMDEVQAAADDYNSWVTMQGDPARLADGRCVWGLSTRADSEEPHMCPVSFSELETGVAQPDDCLTPAQIRGAL